MRCDTAREAISALIDNEDPGVPGGELDEHLRACRGCRHWKQAAHALTRSARIETARAPALDPIQIASVVRASTRVPSRPSRLTLARLALVVTAVGQIVIAVPALFYGRDHTAPMHVAHELGSFDLALAVGFLAAAWRPERARGMSPLVGAVAFLLAVTAISDLIGGRTDIGDEAPHLLAVFGWLLLLWAAAEAPPSTAEPGGLKRVLTMLRRPRDIARPTVWPSSASRAIRRRDVA